MSRRGLIGTLVAAHNRQVKAQARAATEAERARLRNERERMRTNAREAREAVRSTKEAKKAYEEARIAETASLNADLAARKNALETLLPDGLHAFPPLFDGLRKELPALEIPKHLTVASPAPLRAQFAVPDLTFWQGLLPGRKTQHQLALQQADGAFHHALQQHQQAESARKLKIEGVKKAHQAQVDALRKEIDTLEGEYRKGDARAIAEYYGMVLDRSDYPDDFPEQRRVAFIPESKQLVVEYQLPHPEAVPSVSEYRYVKAKDQIDEKKAHASDVKELYGDVVAAVALRTLHLIVAADLGGFVEVVVFNGFVEAVDPATGKDIRPHLVSVRVTKQQFMEIDLRKVQLRSCLRNLGAQLTQSPTELVPVRPIIEFDMADKRFVTQADLLSNLESRPNIMELSPFEFETLVSNLFGKMGLESKLTRSSRDGGVDAVAFDKRPVLGGKVVVQAKRYRHTVGVSAVRDLFGTMMNEGANKGILVTTSGYGPDAYEFAKDKPIELIDGGGLLYLLEQVGTKARIDIPPEDD
jgi:restriction system protein